MQETAVEWETVHADAVALMSRYVHFDTTNPPGKEMAAAQWLCEQLLSRGVTQDVTVHEPLPGRGLLVARIPGEQALKPLVVNHHLDEVTAHMFHAVAAGQKFPASLLLNSLGNPLVRRVAAGQLTANKMINALVRDTVRLTVSRTSYKTNVIPESAEAELDCRLLPDTKAEEFHSWLVAHIADPRVKVESIHKSAPSGVAPLSGPFLSAVAGVIGLHVPGAGVFPLLMNGATDGHYWRERGYAAYGFSPAVLDPPDIGRVHGIDERISSDNLLLGVKMVYDVIRELCVADQ